MSLIITQKQKKKPLTFEQICPRWDEMLKTGVANPFLDMSHPKCCIVGEAHGFSEHYDDCDECADFSYGRTVDGVHSFAWYFCHRRGLFIEDSKEFERLKEDFVRHWNEVHVKQ